MSDDQRLYLTEDEAERVIGAARKSGRQGTRDHALLLMTYRHGLRASEAVGMAWHDIDLKAGTIHINRRKGSISGRHNLKGDEIRALRAVKRDFPDGSAVFQSERGGNLSPDMFARVIARAGEKAGLAFHVHPHMLRHSCGYKLVNQGTDIRLIQGYLGHKCIENTTRYTALAPNAFRDIWKD
jgi:site-specific recombinase XerD